MASPLAFVLEPFPHILPSSDRAECEVAHRRYLRSEMLYYALIAAILLAISAILTFVGGRSRRSMAIAATACAALLMLVDVVDTGRVGPLAWEWVLISVGVPLVTAVTIAILAATKAARWIQVLVGAVGGFAAIVVVGLLVNVARGR